MGSKKKRKSKKKQFWGMPKKERLEISRSWVSEHEGENIVKAYSKKFGLNLKNALKELTSSGFNISKEEKEEIERLIKVHKQQRENKKIKKNAYDLIESDETFAFIAGYTDGGIPFGITHEEMEDIEKEELDEIQR